MLFVFIDLSFHERRRTLSTFRSINILVGQSSLPGAATALIASWRSYCLGHSKFSNQDCLYLSSIAH